MSAVPRATRGGLKGFRLSDVPLDIRLKAKELLLFGNGTADRVVPVVNDPFMRTEIGVVADFPSATVYWISEKAWTKVMEPKPKRSRKKKEAA